MVNTEIRLIMLFDRDALYRLQKKKKKKRRRNQGKLQGSWLNNWVYTDDVYRDKED